MKWYCIRTLQIYIYVYIYTNLLGVLFTCIKPVYGLSYNMRYNQNTFNKDPFTLGGRVELI